MNHLLKLILLSMILGMVSLSAQGFKNCNVKVDIKSNYNSINEDDVFGFIESAIYNTDIGLITEESNTYDYNYEIIGYQQTDTYKEKLAHFWIKTKIWPAGMMKNRSAIESEIKTKNFKLKKDNSQLIKDLYKKAISSSLVSCADISKLFNHSGNGVFQQPIDGDEYQTKKGAKFKRVGKFWKDPSGMLWSDLLEKKYQNDDYNSPAVKACEQMKAKLPTVNDYKKLYSYFSLEKTFRGDKVLSEAGKVDFNTIFPWSSGFYATSTRSPDGTGYNVHHETGRSSESIPRREFNVRCVKR